jgi:hypothetical protein
MYGIDILRLSDAAASWSIAQGRCWPRAGETFATFARAHCLYFPIIENFKDVISTCDYFLELKGGTSSYFRS